MCEQSVVVAPIESASYEIDALNMELAELIGWTDIQFKGGFFFGAPPANCSFAEFMPHCMMPSWTRFTHDAISLQTEHFLTVGVGAISVSVSSQSEKNLGQVTLKHMNFSSKDECVRHAIVRFVINKLKAEKFSCK
ncbi:hypothetical protein [Undibacterium crateris]|uniref:hypothetical protein n=1 Tax=Undibacterium crateris TaxID=2528175 RepID=UPI001389AEB6|nr:hypothetical protein [Undibacterium crateris]NDI85090.1 hypothetical protein [Undibacterium crateris]